jgi:hypothetical protein
MSREGEKTVAVPQPPLYNLKRLVILRVNEKDQGESKEEENPSLRNIVDSHSLTTHSIFLPVFLPAFIPRIRLGSTSV